MALAQGAPLREEFPRLLMVERHQPGYVRALERARLNVRRFAATHVRPRALEIDRRAAADHGYFDWEITKAGLPYRLLSLTIPTQAGGVASGAIAETAVAIEELAAACPGVALIFGAHGLGAGPLLVGGLSHWDGCLAEIAAAEKRGEPLLMGFAITEPGAGTDVESPDLIGKAELNSRAPRVDGGFRLSGTKCFISNGNVARWITVFMPVDPKRPAETLTCFLVDTQTAGFSVGRVERKLGQRASPAAEIVFDEVFVSERDVVGRVGDGLPLTMLILATSRPCVGAIATGIARGAYERLVEWANGDGAAIRDRQYFQLAMADIATEIHLARQAYMDAVTELDLAALGPVIGHPALRVAGVLPMWLRHSSLWQRLNGGARAREATVRLMHSRTSEEAISRSLGLSSLAKVVGADVAMSVTNRALELVGLDAGPVTEELEKLWRDAKLTQIYEGTNQLNRLEVFQALCAGETTYTLPRLSPNGGGP